MREELCRLEKLGIIKPVNTQTDWVSAFVVTPKRSGDIRLCIDTKPLNEALLRNHYPTPNIEDILPELHQARIFSNVDAKAGFGTLSLTVRAATLLHLPQQGSSRYDIHINNGEQFNVHE